MTLPADPTELIVPVVTVTTGTVVAHELWGTAFLVQPNVFMSAKHVLDIGVPEGQTLSVVLLRPGVEPVPFPIASVYSDPDRDIAIARVEGWPRSDFLSISPDDQLTMNTNILAIEYSEPDRGFLRDDGTTGIVIDPNWHKGYMVRQYIASFGHHRPTACIDVSFPALKGASGAPIIDESSGLVLGLINGNIERVLLPTQMAPVVRNNQAEEEPRYLAPYGQAIRARHLRKTLRDHLGPREHPEHAAP